MSPAQDIVWVKFLGGPNDGELAQLAMYSMATRPGGEDGLPRYVYVVFHPLTGWPHSTVRHEYRSIVLAGEETMDMLRKHGEFPLIVEHDSYSPRIVEGRPHASSEQEAG